jgi:WD40 repeat protein
MAGLRRLVMLILFTSLLTQLLSGQQPGNAVPGGPCAMPSFSRIVNEPNIFTEQQEEWLGDIMDQAIRREFNIVEDPEGYLQKIGERLLAQLPPTAMHYHFVIVDAPDLNSFGVAGGRIYIHRRMIAFTHNEGELAALLGHEIGHAATHQVAIEMTSWLRSLGVTSVGDRQDVLNKWNLFKDNAAKIKEHGGVSRERDEQFIADRVGLYAMTRAGYDPAQFVEFADRSLETKGKTGGFWSDFFGTTSFGSKRLREIMRNSTPLPANCIAPFTVDTGHFTKWQQDVIASRRVVAQEDLPGLVRKTSLQPQLRGDIYNIEFSGDGKYLLAQDASSVFVMTREPLANVFRIDAIDSHMAQFSPDSSAVVFYDKELRVEKWDIPTQQRTALHALTVPDCYQTSLSPSGEYMACVQLSRDYEFSLQVIEVNTNQTVYTRARLYTPYWSEMFSIYLSRVFDVPGHTFELRFSPDSRYLLAGHQTAALAYDLQSRAEVHLSSRIRDLMKFTFAFISRDEIAGVEYSGASNKLVRCRFPSGEKNDEFKLQAYGRLFSTSQSSYLLMRPAGAYPVGIIDLNKKTISQGFRSPGFAIYGQVFAGEQTSGEVALFSSEDQKRIGKVQLPDSPLAGSKTSAFSPDGKWLAVSGDTRGALWQMDNGERIFFTHAFEGAFFDRGQLVAKFAQKEPDPSRVFQLDPVSKETKRLYDLDLKEHRAAQQGDLLIRLRPEKEQEQQVIRVGQPAPGDLFFRGNSVLEVRDVRSNTVLWERKMGKSLPRFFYDGNVLTLVVGNFDNIKEAAKEDPQLNAVLNTIDGKRDVYMLQAFEAKTGKLLGNVIVDTGKLSFKVEWAVTVGDTMLVADSIDRTLVYSLQLGQQKGKILGHLRAATADGSRMLIELNRGIVEVFETATLQPVNHLSFPSRISHAQFTGDGKTLMVLTADQNVYQLDLKASQQTASTH